MSFIPKLELKKVGMNLKNGFMNSLISAKSQIESHIRAMVVKLMAH